MTPPPVMSQNGFEQCTMDHTFNITEEDTPAWLYTAADDIIITVVMPIILTVGIVNNSAFLFVIFRVPAMRSTTNVYLVHLALADLVYLIVFNVYTFRTYVMTPVVLDQHYATAAGCVVVIITANTGYFTSIGLITLVSLERYLALCHPIQHLNIRSQRRTYRFVATCWCIGLAIAVVTVADSARLQIACLLWPWTAEYQGFPVTITMCVPVAPWVEYYTIPLVDIPWLMALVCNTFMYVVIIRRMNNKNGNRRRRRRDSPNHVAKMLIVNGIIFFICQTPYRIFNFTAWLCLLTGWPNPFAGYRSLVYWVSFIPQMLNTVVNPLVYGAMNPRYRTAFYRAFRCRLSRDETSCIAIISTDNTSCGPQGNLMSSSEV